MSELLKQTIARVTNQIETRRVTGILRKSPGALGEPANLLAVVQEKAPYVSRGEIYRQIEQEVCRHRGNLESANPV